MLKRHWSYIKYICRHKYYVFKAGLIIGCPVWRLILHDASKFTPSEWIPYAHCFYDDDGNQRYQETEAFNQAWLFHQNRNKHHWQYWVLIKDGGKVEPMVIPSESLLEMVSDWAGAGRAITGTWEVDTWFKRNHEKMMMHPQSKSQAEYLVKKFMQSIK